MENRTSAIPAELVLERARSWHPDSPGVAGQGGRGDDIQTPSAASPWPVPSDPLALSCASFQDAQPASGSRELWPDTGLDLTTEMMACCCGLNLIFANEVLWIFVVMVMVIDAASLPRSDGASDHVAVRVGLGRIRSWNCQKAPCRLVWIFA